MIFNGEYENAGVDEAVKYLIMAADKHDTYAAKIYAPLLRKGNFAEADNVEASRYERIANS